MHVDTANTHAVSAIVNVDQVKSLPSRLLPNIDRYKLFVESGKGLEAFDSRSRRQRTLGRHETG
jgi:hypothetical protein